MKWKPVIQGSDSERIKNKISEIADILRKNPMKTEEIGLLSGKAGLVVFLFYYSIFTGDDSFADDGLEIVSEIFDTINNGYAYHTFCTGLAGVGWVIEHLKQNDLLDVETDEVLDELDLYFQKRMIEDIKSGNYDFLHGALGLGCYFLNRLSNDKSKEYLIQLIDELKKQGKIDKDSSIKWLSVLDQEKGTKGFNLSLSHGLASIIGFLSKMLEVGIYREKVSFLLDGAVRYLLKCSLDTKKYGSNFPSWIQEGEPLNSSRLAWCYGDLGIGISLWQASRSMGSKELEKRAIDVLLHTTRRRDPVEEHVADAGLCHGAAGIAHIYNRIYNYTGMEAFKESAIYWFDQTLKMATFDDGYAGYKAWYTEKHGGWQNQASILEGIAGIGLAMISAISDIEPKWDRCLLLS